MLGCVDADMQDLLMPIEKFLWLHYLDLVAFRRLFIVGGATSRISAFVARLKLIPGLGFGSDRQHRTLLVVNNFEAQGLADNQTCKLPIPFLDSSISDVQQLVVKFLLHEFMEDQLQKNQKALPFSYTACWL